jgi:hypothetical protein
MCKREMESLSWDQRVKVGSLPVRLKMLYLMGKGNQLGRQIFLVFLLQVPLPFHGFVIHYHQRFLLELAAS